jgi:hypothetical protein
MTAIDSTKTSCLLWELKKSCHGLKGMEPMSGVEPLTY